MSSLQRYKEHSIKKPRLGVDVDQTLINTSIEWWKYLEITTKKGLKYSDVCHLYDFSLAYKKELDDRAEHPMAFWRQKHLYDHLRPMENVVEVLKEVSKTWNIVFVSQTKGNHIGSKADFLNEWFPFREGMLFTKEKWLANIDVLIDDRLDHLQKCSEEGIVTIQFMSPHEQYVQYSPDYVLEEWSKLEETLEKVNDDRDSGESR